MSGEPGAEPSTEPLTEPSTEAVNPHSRGIDRKGAREIVEIIHREDQRAWMAVGSALDALARLVELVVRSFRRGGRLIYVGAGTSGRLGALDAAECPPTFGVETDRVLGIIAGGEPALRRSVEGAEDSPEEGRKAILAAQVSERDVVCGIAASGTTPYVLGALEEAARQNAATALIVCNPVCDPAPGSRGDGPGSLAGVVVELPVGPEVIAGSTRMKGGTATKMALNMITTAAMIRWGKVYDNLMVDLRPVNRKLVRRAIGLIERLGGVDRNAAAETLRLSGDDVKAAIVMARLGVSRSEAHRLLEKSEGFLRAVIDPPALDRGSPGNPEEDSFR